MPYRSDHGGTFAAARLLAGIAALAVLAVAFAALAGSARADDPEPDVQLRVWQSVAEPLRLWVSSRPDDAASWRTVEAGMAVIEGGGWRAGSVNVSGTGGQRIELRLWQNPAALDELHLSARPAGASWSEYGTRPLALDRTSANSRYRYADLEVALAQPDAAPPLPGSEAVELCIPEGLGTETLETRVWRSTSTPARYWITSRPAPTARWTTREVSLAPYAASAGAGNGGAWSVGALTADAGDARFELALWSRGDETQLSARVAGAAWDEHGTRAADLATTSRNGRYTYANIDITLTLPEADPPLPGEEAPTWACPEATPTPTPTAAATGGFPGGFPGGSPGGALPNAVASVTPASTTEGGFVDLDGSDSTGVGLTYAWTHDKTGAPWDDQTTGLRFIPSADVAKSRVILPAGQEVRGSTITFTLTVTDSADNTDTAEVRVTVTDNQRPVVTVTAPAANDTVHQGDKVELSGSATDPDSGDTIARYLWGAWWTKDGTLKFINVTDSACRTKDSTTTPPCDPHFTVPAARRHGDTIYVGLAAYDNQTPAATGSIIVSVTVQNGAPTGTNLAGDDQNAARGSAVTLAAGTATDPDGDSLTYSWAHTGGTYKDRTDKTIAITGATSATFNMPKDANVDETVIATLTVSDGYGGSYTDEVTITAKNATPTANASATGTTRGEMVTLDGSASSDPDGTLTYSWAKSATSTCTETITLSSTTAQKPTFTLPTACADASTLVFTLTVTDNDSATATDDVTVTVGNVAPTVDAGSNVSTTAGVGVTLSPTANDPDGDNDEIRYAWGVNPTSLNERFSPNPTTKAVTFTPFMTDAAGKTYDLTLTVTDEDGATASDTVTVTVSTANSGPSSAEAGAAQTVNQGATVNLSGSGTDAENDALTYSWAKTGGTYTGSVTLTNANTATPSFTAPNLTGLTSSVQSKTIILTLTVSDAVNRTATDTVTITVQNAKPTVSISSANVTASNSHKPSATVNDPDGDNANLTYAWSLQGAAGTQNATVANANTAAPTIGIPWNASLNSTYTLRVTVTDEDGAASTQASATLTVNNRAPTADATGTSYGQPGAKIYLLGTHSTDPDGDTTEAGTLTCSWEKAGGSYDGTAGYTLQYATSCNSTRFTVPSDATSGETIIVRLTVTDSKGGTDTDGWTVSVGTAPPPSNTAPTANAGADQDFRMGQNNNKVTVDASGSSDSEGGALSYSWAVTGQYASLVTLQSNSATPHIVSFTWPSQAGLGKGFNVTVTVCDPHDACGSDTMVVKRKHGLTVSIAHSTSGASCSNRTPFTNAYRGTINNPDGFPTVTWGDWTVTRVGDTSLTEPAAGVTVATESGNQYTLRWETTAPTGTYTITARVTGSGLQKFDSSGTGRTTFTLLSSSQTCP